MELKHREDHQSERRKHQPFNRTSMELKQTKRRAKSDYAETFNRTSMELKPAIYFQRLTNIFTFNRTSMELKQKIPTRTLSNMLTFNRTSMELKLRNWESLERAEKTLLIEPVWN